MTLMATQPRLRVPRKRATEHKGLAYRLTRLHVQVRAIYVGVFVIVSQLSGWG